MEVIYRGTDDVHALESLTCCYPAGTMSRSTPEGD